MLADLLYTRLEIFIKLHFYLEQGSGHLGGNVLLEADLETSVGEVDPVDLSKLLKELLDNDVLLPALEEVAGLNEDLVTAREV